MSSKIEVQKMCQFCGELFTARTTVTKYCSHRCGKNAYKQQMRDEKINKSNQDVLTQLSFSEASILKDREYLSVRETATVLGIHRATIYRYLAAHEIKCMTIRGKTFIRKRDIDALFEYAKPYRVREQKPRQPITEFYTMEEILEKYAYGKGWVYQIIKDHKIPKVMHRGRTLYSRKHIDKVLSAREPDPAITEWYTVEEIQQKYGMTYNAVRSFVYEKNIPKTRKGKKGYYSKMHFDRAKGIAVPEDTPYYTMEEAMAKYNLTRDSLYYHIKVNNIPKIKEGRYVKISRKELDEVFEKQPIIY